MIPITLINLLVTNFHIYFTLQLTTSGWKPQKTVLHRFGVMNGTAQISPIVEHKKYVCTRRRSDQKGNETIVQNETIVDIITVNTSDYSEPDWREKHAPKHDLINETDECNTNTLVIGDKTLLNVKIFGTRKLQ